MHACEHNYDGSSLHVSVLGEPSYQRWICHGGGLEGYPSRRQLTPYVKTDKNPPPLLTVD